jgi:hypothetical protein
MGMRVLSASDAISPAVEWTKSLLFRPFRWGTFLKLCAVAIFSEGASGNFNFNFPSHGDTTPTSIGVEPSALGFLLSPGWIAIIVSAAVALIAISFAIFYLMVRLRFALFECLIRQTRLIAPGWHKYRSQAFRFFILSIVVGFVFLLMTLVVLLPFILGFWHLFQHSRLGSDFPTADFLELFLPLLPLFLLIIVAGISIHIVLRDFMLPHIALEDATAGQAWAAVRTRIFREKGAFLLYAVLRVFVPFAVILAIVIVLAIPCLIVFGILGGGLYALHSYLDQTTMFNMIIGSFFEVILGLAIFALALLLVISFFGPVNIAVRYFALLFYGGRFQPLGDILSPPAPGPPPMQPEAA